MISLWKKFLTLSPRIDYKRNRELCDIESLQHFQAPQGMFNYAMLLTRKVYLQLYQMIKEECRYEIMEC